ncbi:hypothetical protein HOY80DRAFT_1036953 [Tuber brumale]|nr:hypothetical protein HOY80DRAFT_1036953 [Tuber brumale]
MTGNNHEDMSERSTPTDTSASSNNGMAIPKTLNSSVEPLKVTHTSVIPCSVFGCLAVFQGKTAHLDFWRHFEQPDLSGLAGNERAEWVDFHREEPQRYLISLSLTPLPQP